MPLEAAMHFDSFSEGGVYVGRAVAIMCSALAIAALFSRLF